MSERGTLLNAGNLAASRFFAAKEKQMAMPKGVVATVWWENANKQERKLLHAEWLIAAWASIANSLISRDCVGDRFNSLAQ